MATVDQQFFLIAHPMTARDQRTLGELTSRLQQMGYMHHERLGPVPEGSWVPMDGQHDFTEGTLEQFEWRRTLDYNRDERREARRQKRKLEPNQFKSIVPAGWKVIGPDDPRHSSHRDPTPG